MSQEARESSSTVKTRSDSRERSNMEMPILSRSNSRTEKDRAGTHSSSEAKDKGTKSEGMTLKVREGPSSLSRSESRDSTRSSKSESSKHKTESKQKTDTPDKKIKYIDSDKKTKSTPPVIETTPESENKGPPIKLKLMLSQIKPFTPAGNEDTDSEASFDESYIESRRSKKKDGSSGKKKRNKSKKKSKSQQPMDSDSLAPPELELMETGGDTTTEMASDPETNDVVLDPPGPLHLPDVLDNNTSTTMEGGATPGGSGVGRSRSLSFMDIDDEDTSGYVEKTAESVKICSFCGCGRQSLLGQGDLTRYDPTVGYNPFKQPRPVKKSGAELDEKGPEKGPKPATSRRKPKRDPLRSPRRAIDDDSNEGFDELATVGFLEDTEISSLFEPSGHTWAHHCCAAWSEGVTQDEDCSLRSVDKAVVAGLSNRCSFCYRYGATINCRYTGCNKIYHYPCASGGGCFQDIKTLTMLCPEHTADAETIAGEEALCAVCNTVGDISQQLFCTSCGHHYHSACLHPAVDVNPTVRAGWQCFDCKICLMCRNPGEDSKMLVCDMCDKGYHMFCLKPAMTSIPKNGWKCKNCRICVDCQSRTPGSGKSSRWHSNYTVCDSCYQQRHKGLCCPLCGRAYRHSAQKAMVQCNMCRKLVHSECDSEAIESAEPLDYLCRVCRTRDPEMDMPDFPTASQSSMIEDSSDIFYPPKVGSGEEMEESSQHSSAQFPFHLNDDSCSSQDVDPNFLEKMSPSYMFPGKEGDIMGPGRGKLSIISRKKLSIASKQKGRGMPGGRGRPISFVGKRRGPKPKNGTMLGRDKKKTDSDDDDDDHPNTIILANKADKFTFDQDVCKSCGSFGKGEEGRMLACTQCGQCYHPYCANIKYVFHDQKAYKSGPRSRSKPVQYTQRMKHILQITKVVLQKGWRCLDCTVCEGCGKPHDEGRLLLCDECDISYHTYCLDPPLDHVPKGTWKCKWCVMCIICGSKSPGFGCQWQRNYTHCAPCHSKISCPVCRMKYQDDELIMQCVQCSRWLHSFCDGIHSEDDAERAAEFGYHCIFCRPRTGQTGPLPPDLTPPSKDLPLPFTFPAPPVREYEPPRYYLCDGILMTQQAKRQIEKIVIDPPKVRRTRRWSKKPEDWDEGREAEQMIERKMQEILEVRKQHGDTLDTTPQAVTAPALSRLLSVGSDKDDEKSMDLKSPDGLDEIKAEAMKQIEDEKKLKKKRNIAKVGIGGFNVNKRKPQKRPLDGGGGSMDGPSGSQMGSMDGEDTMPGPGAEEEKPKKWARKVGPGRRRSALQENFPSYMQEAFFGSDLMVRSKEATKEGLKVLEQDEEKQPTEAIKLFADTSVREESSIEISSQIRRQLAEMPKLPSDIMPPADAMGADDMLVDATVSPPAADADFQIPDELDIDDNFIKMIEEELGGTRTHEDIETGFNDALDEVEREQAAQEASKTSAADSGKHLSLDDQPVMEKQPGTSNVGLDDGLDEDKNILLEQLTSISADDVPGLEPIDSKTVEDIFKGVLSDNDPPTDQSTVPVVPDHPGPPGMGVSLPAMSGVVSGPALHSPHGQGPVVPVSAGMPPGLGPEHHPHMPSHPQLRPPQHPVDFPMGPHDGMGQNMPPLRPPFHRFPPPAFNQPPGPQPQFPGFNPAMSGWPGPSLAPDETVTQENSRRNMQKWESDEDLGENATISPILYCNLKHPELKQEYPDWSERSKQIAKIWRKLTPEEKQPYLLKARKNRGNNKQTNKTPKAQTATQRKKAEAAMSMQGQLPGMRPSDIFPSPDSARGAASPGNSSPGGIQSPMRAQMLPGTPGGQSPSQPSPGQPYPQDPYQTMPQTPRGQDPYAMPPHTPRQMGPDFNIPPGTPRSAGSDSMGPSPTSRKPMDPYSQPPMTPRAQGEQVMGPVRGQDHFGHGAGMHGPDAPYQQGPPRSQASGVWPGQDSYLPPPGSQSGQMPPPGLERQISTPITSGVSREDPYAFTSTSEQHLVSPEHFSHPPATMTGAGPRGAQRPPMQRMQSMPGDMSHMHPGAPHFRQQPPFRHPSQTMRLPVKPGSEAFPHQPGGPRPRLEGPMQPPGVRGPEPSALQRIFDVAKRQQIASLRWPQHVQALAGGQISRQQMFDIIAQKEGVLPPGDGARLPHPGAQVPVSGISESAVAGSQGLPPMPATGDPQVVKTVALDYRGQIKKVAKDLGLLGSKGKPGSAQQGEMGAVASSSAETPGIAPTSTASTVVTQPSSAGAGEKKIAEAKSATGAGVRLSEDDLLLGDFLNEDGSFDILKYADPDLDLGSDNKTIFDDLVDDSGEKKGEEAEVKSEVKTEGETTEDKPQSVTDFQAQFMSFSQKKQAEGMAKTDGLKQEPGKSPALSRQVSIKQEGSEAADSGKAPSTPGTPLTPAEASALRAGQIASGVASPHQAAMYNQPSPTATGMPSPKVMPMPSPKSLPSPRTPGGEHMSQQQSPFSQQHSIQSPFSPSQTPASAPQSPYAGSVGKSQSPFAIPGAGSQHVTMINQGSPVSCSPSHTPPANFPMQRSPRPNVPQTGQFPGQGQFAPQGFPPRGMVPGQPGHPFNQAGMRQAGPGVRPPTSLPLSQQQQQQMSSQAGLMSGPELMSPGPAMRPMHPGMRLERPHFSPGHPPSSPGKPGQVPTGMYANMQQPGMRVSTPGSQPMFMSQPGYPAQLPSGPAGSTVASSTVTATTTSRSSLLQEQPLLKDQPLLIQDLLEQEKLEQEKRQREQAAMLHRTGAIRPEGMMGPRGPPGPPGMVGMPPGGLRMEAPLRHPGQPGMFAQPDGVRARMPGPLSPHTVAGPGGAPPQGFPPPPAGHPPGTMGPGGQMPPPKPPTPVDTAPDSEAQHYRYENWLMKHQEYIEMQVKFLEQQIQKQKRTKKAINARNRQAKKNGQEMPAQDVMELERASQEQSMLNKQLDQMKKQRTKHSVTMQDYRSKKQEKYSMQMSGPGGPGQPVVGGMMPGMPPASMGPQPGGAAPQAGMQLGPGMAPGGVRMPGMQGAVRLTPSMRHEYDMYVQNRLRQMGPGSLPPGQRFPRPPMMAGPGAPQPRMAIGDNNPFSDTYQQQEQIEKMREKHAESRGDAGAMPGTPTEGPQGPPMGPQGPPMGPGFSGEHPPRFPGPREAHPGAVPPRYQPPGSVAGPMDPQHPQHGAWLQQQQQQQGQQHVQPGVGPHRFPMEQMGPRMAMQGPPGAEHRMPGPPFSGPSTSQVFTTEANPPPTSLDAVANTESKEKSASAKKRKKKKKPADSNQAGSNQQPLGKPPPIQHKPQDETERRIMEILTNSANLQRGTATTTSTSASPATTSSTATSAGTTATTVTTDGQPQASATGDSTDTSSVPATPAQPLAQPAKTPPMQGHMPAGPAGGRSTPGATTQHPAIPQGRLTPSSQGRLTPGSQGRLTPGSQGRSTPGATAQGRLTPGQAPVASPGGTALLSTNQKSPAVPSATASSPMETQGIPSSEQTIATGMSSVESQGSVPSSVQPVSQTLPSSTGISQQTLPPLQSQASLGGGPMTPALALTSSSPSTSVQGQVTDSRPPISQQSGQQTAIPASGQMPPIPGQPNVRLGHPGAYMGPRPLRGQMPGQRPMHPGQEIGPQGQQVHPAFQGPRGQFQGFPPGSLPAHFQQFVQQRGESPQGPAGFAGFEHIPSHLRQRPPMQPHWMAPDASNQPGMPASRKSPRPAMPGMDPALRMARPMPGSQLPNMPGQPPNMSGMPLRTPSSAGQMPGLVHHQHAMPGQRGSVPDHSTTAPALSQSAAGAMSVPPTATSMPPSQPTVSTAPGQPAANETSGLKSTSQELTMSTPSATTVQSNQGAPSTPNTDMSMAQISKEECTPTTETSSQLADKGTEGTNASKPVVAQPSVESCKSDSPSSTDKEVKEIASSANSEQQSSQADKQTVLTESSNNSNTSDEKQGDTCKDGTHCGTPPPDSQCTDGIHCGTPPPAGQCTDGIHCGTPPPEGQCTDGIHCGTPPPEGECTDGIHCGTPPPAGQCTDGIHCGTPPPQGECTDGIHCGTPPPTNQCTDGIHCGTPPPEGQCTDGIHCGTPPPQGECTDGIHCGTPPPTSQCTDGIHCGTPPPEGQCTDGIHCGTPPPQGECTDGIHCGTPPPTSQCTDGIHCGTPPPEGQCTDGIHCGTPPPQGECTDGIHCGTPPPTSQCTDGIHCGTPPPEGQCTDGIHCGTPPPQGECTDGIHCGTPPPMNQCTDGIHCGTPPPDSQCMDGIHCGTPPPQGECTDGIHCGTPPPQGECTDGIHCGTPPPGGQCTDGIHCGTPPPEGQCTDGIHCGTPPPQGECTDGIHCGTPPPQGECTDGIHCGTPPPQGECTDGIHCGTPPPDSQCMDGIHCGTPPPQGECTDGIHCGTPPPAGQCNDGIHCGTPPPQSGSESNATTSASSTVTSSDSNAQLTISSSSLSTESQNTTETCVPVSETLTVVTSGSEVAPPPLEPAMLSPQQMSVHADHPYITVPPTLKPTAVTSAASSDPASVAIKPPSPEAAISSLQSEGSAFVNTTAVSVQQLTTNDPQPPEASSQGHDHAPVQPQKSESIQHPVGSLQQSSGSVSTQSSSVLPVSEPQNTQHEAMQIETQDLSMPVQVSEQQLIPEQNATHSIQATTAATTEVEKMDTTPAPESQSATVPNLSPSNSFKGSMSAALTEHGQLLPQTSQSATLQTHDASPTEGTHPPRQTLDATPQPSQAELSAPASIAPVSSSVGHNVTSTAQGADVKQPDASQSLQSSQLPARATVSSKQVPETSPTTSTGEQKPASADMQATATSGQPIRPPITTVPRPQHFGSLPPLPNDPQDPRPRMFPGRFPFSGLTAPEGQHPSMTRSLATASSVPNIQQRFANMEGVGRGAQMPGFGHQPMQPGQQAMNRMPRPEHMAARMPGQDPRMTLPGADPRMMQHPMSSTDMRPTMEQMHQQRAQMQVRGPHGQVPPGYPGMEQHRGPVPSSASTTGAQDPRYFLQDPRYAMAVNPGIGHPEQRYYMADPRHGYPEQMSYRHPMYAHRPGMPGMARGQHPGMPIPPGAPHPQMTRASYPPHIGQQGAVKSEPMKLPTIPGVPHPTTPTGSSPAMPMPGGGSPASAVDVKPVVTQVSPQGSVKAQTPPAATGPGSQPNSNRSTPISRPPSVQRQSPAMSQGSQRSSPAQSQSPGHAVGLSAAQDDLQLPSVSETFAAAGMMRLGGDDTAKPLFRGDKQESSKHGTASGPGFSSVSSIVQAVSTVTFPAMGQAVSTAPTEVALPPSTHVKTEVMSPGTGTSTQSPVQSRPNVAIASQPGTPPAASTPNVSHSVAPLGAQTGPHFPPQISGQATPTTTGAQPTYGPPMSGAPGGPAGPRMHGPPATTGQPARARGQRQQQAYNQPRYSLPSNLPPHLAGMLYNQRPQKPGSGMYSQGQERHMEPMGPRFPPGHPMGMPPRGFPGQPAGDGNPMQIPRHMMVHPGMRPPGARQMGPQGPMTAMHPGQMSPTAHPGGPAMHHPVQGPPTSGMMGPPGMPHVMPSHTPPEMVSPTQRHPPTPGSMPSTPSPTPASYPHGVIPPASSAGMARASTPPGFPGDTHMQPFQQFPRMPGQRMMDPRMPFDPSTTRPGSDEHQFQGRLPPGFRGFPGGISPSKEGQHELMSSPHQLDEALKRMQSSAGAMFARQMSDQDTITPSAAQTMPLATVKQEPSDMGMNFHPVLSQHALLKKLLAKKKGNAAASGQATPLSDHSEDSNDVTQLTPEQQRQLEMIEKMPLTKETLLPEAGPRLDANDPDIDAKKQEFERRRKELEVEKKLKKKATDGPKKRKKKNKDQDQQPPAMSGLPGQMDANPMGVMPPYDPQQGLGPHVGEKGPPGGAAAGAAMFEGAVGPGTILSPEKEKKKRSRKTKKEKAVAAAAAAAVTESQSQEAIIQDNLFETFNLQLKQLPPVPLMEPYVGNAYAICSLPGSSQDAHSESVLAGMFGVMKMSSATTDFYYELVLGNVSPSILNKEIEKRRLSEKIDLAGLTEDQRRYQMMLDSIQGEGQRPLSPPFGIAALGPPRGAVPTLPAQPRVGPKPQQQKVTGSPDSLVNSSSPETGFGEDEKPDFPMLRPIDPANQDSLGCTSPTVPLVQPVPIKYPPFLIKQEVDTDAVATASDLKTPLNVQIPAQKGKQDLDSALSALTSWKDNRDVDPMTGMPRSSRDAAADAEVSVTLTLSAKAAEDIGGVLSAIADLLKIAAPQSYDVSRSPSPDQLKSSMKYKEEKFRVHTLPKSSQVQCRHCEVTFVNAGIRKKKAEIATLTKEEQETEEDVLTFCSMNCCTSFTSTREVTRKPGHSDTFTDQMLTGLKDAGMLSPRELGTPSSSTTATPAMTPTQGLESMETTPIKSGPPTPQLGSPTLLSRQQSGLGKRQYRRMSSMSESKGPIEKKWKDKRYRRFESSAFPEVQTVLSKEDDETKLWSEFSVALKHDLDVTKDTRVCEFCQERGDGETNGPARLLNMDIDKWAHLNCALWSKEVYETLNGALMNVEQEYKRSQKQKCVVCMKPGAAIGCFKQRCSNVYHVPCAQLVGCIFFEDKTILCPPHTTKGVPQEQVLKSLTVFRRVYINRDEDVQVANMLVQEDGQHTLRLGSMVLHNIGQLLPHQMAGGKFNTRDNIYPVGFKTSRFYWSMRQLYKRSRYVCTIREQEGSPQFIVTVIEEGHEDLVLQNPTCCGVWKTILEPLEKLHKEADLVKVFPTFTTGEELYGLNDPNIVRLVESLPGTDLLRDYAFKFGRRQLIDLPLTINPSGCARSEPKLRTHFKKPHTLQSSHTHSLPSTVTGLIGDLNNSPYMKHFVQSKSQQYRKLKTEWKNLVYLGRSRIQGLGLYAAKDLEMHTIVIEYIGDLIRNEVANRREKLYESQNRGVYMFRIDNDTVCDATMAGGPARYINHSCDPNCVAEVVDIDKESKIIIITNRRITKGEELSYDYQFDLEDDANKIPCNCGAWNCKKWMN